MRRTMLILFVGFVCFTLSGCGGSAVQQEEASEDQQHKSNAVQPVKKNPGNPNVRSGIQRYGAFTKEFLKLAKEYISVLEGIQDESEAEAAVQKIDNLTGKMEALIHRNQDLPDINKEEDNQLQQKYGEELIKVHQEFLQKGGKAIAKADTSRSKLARAIDRFYNAVEKIRTLKKTP